MDSQEEITVQEARGWVENALRKFDRDDLTKMDNELNSDKKEEFINSFRPVKPEKKSSRKNEKVINDGSVDEKNLKGIPKDSVKKINIYGEEYNKCQEIALEFENSENGKYYSSIMCLKDVGGVAPKKIDTLRGHFNRISPYISNSFEEVKSNQKKKKCVLPKGHKGSCSCTMDIFCKTKTASKIIGKVDQSIYCTPGADDRVIKNRDSRLHPIAITKEDEKNIKESWTGGVKEHKLKCSIPLKEKSTPFMLATAYVDYMTYIDSISDISEIINPESSHYKMCKSMLSKHKTFLVNYFKKNKREVFNQYGNTICAILGKELKTKNLADPHRDNRTEYDHNDIQMGHINSRCDNCYTIYGTNIVMMTRRGNLIIGEHSFIEDTWKLEHKSISIHHNITHINEKQLSILKEKGLSDSDIQLFLSS
jgi:hypothetical protein